uniref:hypothetical protein n=1 Tax=Conidiobolus lichenicola TaxID=1167816 RepID=UPI001D0F6282|nr:hypothetical protein LK371_mgp19 [Conidiobolus lichenicola]QZZ81327.1 hypothetical protein [Conidiobolus lichenicola]
MTKIKSLHNDLNNKFIKWTESPWFTIQFSILFGFFGLIYSLYEQGFFSYIFNMIYCMGEGSIPTSNNKPSPNINISLNITSTIENIGTIVGVGAGIAQVVKVVPPQSKPAVAVGLGLITGGVALGMEAIKHVNNNNMKVTTSDLTSISRPASPINESGDGNTIRSIMELGIFDNIPPEYLVLCCVLLILLIVTYLLLGLIINFLIKNFIDFNLVKWIDKNSFIYKWIKGGNNITTIVIMGIMLYGLISSIYFIYKILKIKGVI